MNDFTTVCPETAKLDPNKRVHYAQGLVLGVDEFLQEELYLLEKDRLHNRTLHGYGTVCGLAVSQEESSDGLRILVRSGIAVNPQGKEIRVPRDQCALLNDWLLHHRSEVDQALGSPPLGPLTLYLALCYRECKTDRVPIPSGPCQSLEEASAPSRIADDFELKLTASKPQQIEEDAIRELFDLLSRIEISDASPGMTREELEELVRSLGSISSPPLLSPPMSDWTLHPDDAREYLRAAFRIWITEVRPKLLENDRNCAGGPPEEPCVLLAQLDCDVDLTALGYRVSGPLQLDESERPYLLSTRVLQENVLARTVSTAHSLLSGLAVGDDHPQYLLTDGSRTLGGDLSAGNHTITDLALAAADADALPLGQLNDRLTQHNTSDDHTHYLLVDGSRALGGDLSAGNNRITNLADPVAGGDALSLGAARRRFVEGAAGPYRIVASGRFDDRGNARGPVYNALAARPRPPIGTFVLNFDGYENPDASPPVNHTYVLKGTVESGEAPGLFQVIRFQRNGIQIRAASLGPGPSTAVGFMVEISEITDG